MIEPEFAQGGGDGTVPLRSGDTRNLAAGVDLSGDATIYYFNHDHGELAKNQDVLLFAAALFANPTTAARSQSSAAYIPGGGASSGILAPSEDASTGGDISTPASMLELPRSTPLPLNVRHIEMYGPVQAEIFNSIGDRAGVLADGGWESNIPGVVYSQIGDLTVIGLPEVDVYTLHITGTQEGKTDIRIDTIIDDQVVQAEVYKDMPFTGETTASLFYDPVAATAGSFVMDYNSDGTPDELIPGDCRFGCRREFRR